MTSTQRSLLSAFGGLLIYAAWAYWVNSMHGEFAAIKAAVVQGSYSFILTFVTSILIESIFIGLISRVERLRLVAVFTVVLSCTLIFSVTWGINVFAGTPEILHTVILGYVFGTFYTIVYVLGLSKQYQNKCDNAFLGRR